MVVNVAAAHCDTLDFSPLDESSSLIFYNVSKQPRAGRHQEARVLQAGTPLGLMAYLYSSGAFLEGYVQQFLYTFRYFCTPQDFLHFLLDRMDSTLARCARPAGPGAHCGRDGPSRGHRCPWGWGRDCPKGRSAPRHQARRVPQSRRPSASNPQPPRTGRGGGRRAPAWSPSWLVGPHRTPR